MFTGTGRLIRLALRRDRIKLPVWIILTVGFIVATVPALVTTYGSAAERAAYYVTVGSSAIGKLFVGNMDNDSMGAVFMAETLLYAALIVAFLNILLVVRHTRQNEELGSSELLQSARVGRFAPLTAALLVAVGANTLVAAGLTAVFVGQSELPQGGALLYGLAVGLFGMAFAAIAGITAQLASTARAASSLASMVVGGAFLLRAIGDFFPTHHAGEVWPLWTSWLSPFGWLQLARPLTLQDWWALLLPIGFTIVAVLAAYGLLLRRDIGQGIMPARLGRARAKHTLLSPFGLALRLQRGVLIGWTVAVLAMVLTAAGMVTQVQDLVEQSPVLQQYLALSGGNITTLFASAMIGITALLIVAYGLQALLKMRSEETNGYVESLLATGVSRMRWQLSHFAVVVGGTTMLLFLNGFLTGVIVGSASAASLGAYTVAGLVYVPPVMMLLAFAFFCFGAIPRLMSILSWAVFGFVLFVSQFANLMKLSPALVNVSPFAHVTTGLDGDVRVLPLVIMLALTAVLLLSGIGAWRTRDIRPSQG